MPGPGACSGSTATRTRPTSGCAAAPTTAASPFTATCCSWARWTPTWWRIDAKNGQPVWNIAVADSKLAYSITLAPLVIKDKVIIGVGGAEYGIRGFVAAYDARTGKEAWRFETIPRPGVKGHETWGGNSWEHGGGSIWVTGSYDPELNLTYWGVGNPGPDWNPDQRPGDNLYTDSVVALDADTGELKWHFQFTPNDAYDYDAVQVPVLADIPWNGAPAKVMLWANRNGFFYVLDRATGKFLRGAPFVKVNWASGLDENGRPIQTPQPPGSATWPGNQGGTNWYSPSFSPRTGLFYVSAWEGYASYYRREHQEFELGRNFAGGGHRVVTPVPDAPAVGIGRRSPVNNWTDAVGHGAVIALDPRTGAAEVEVRSVRRDRQRHPDDGHRPAVHRRARGALPCARRAHRRAALEGQPRGPDRQRTHQLPDRWSAVCRHHRRQLAGGVCAAVVSLSWLER